MVWVNAVRLKVEQATILVFSNRILTLKTIKEEMVQKFCLFTNLSELLLM